MPAGSGRGIAAEGRGEPPRKGRTGAPKALDAAALQASIDAGYLPTYEGDPTRNDSYRAYGEPLLAVADGTVVTVSSGARDEQPQVVPTGLSAAQLGGNAVVLDIGNGVFAFYAHLHFHLMRSQAPVTGDNVPFEIDSLTFEGSMVLPAVPFVGFKPGPDPGPRANQLPLEVSVVDFPAAP